jgi:ribosomal protein S18 acetylase RimI-like enzyme
MELKKSPEVISVIKSVPDDVREFVELMILSAPRFLPQLYGIKVKTVLVRFFVRILNLFSYCHTLFAIIDEKKAGMMLSYNWQVKKKEDLRTGMLLFRFLGTDFIRKFPLFWSLQNIVGELEQGEYYISNVASYTAYRNRGIGTILLKTGEKEARKQGATKMALDVETDNVNAIRLYEKLGYHIFRRSSAIIADQKFEFFRMNRDLS